MWAALYPTCSQIDPSAAREIWGTHFGDSKGPIMIPRGSKWSSECSRRLSKAYRRPPQNMFLGIWISVVTCVAEKLLSLRSSKRRMCGATVRVSACRRCAHKRMGVLSRRKCQIHGSERTPPFFADGSQALQLLLTFVRCLLRGRVDSVFPLA